MRMKKMLLVYEEGAKREYEDILKQLREHEIWTSLGVEEVEELELKHVGSHGTELVKLSGCQADVIISFNMAGFQYKTLLDNYRYNIMPVRQLHLILKEEVWEQYKTSEFAMNVFVYVPDEKIDSIEAEKECHNRRYYGKQLLESKSDMVDCILKDFVQAARMGL